MTETKRLALVARLNQKLRVHGSWCGETHMQKATYFLQYMLDVRMDFDFVLYKHGPYSFDLRDAISQMRADGILEVRQRPYPYGPSLVVPPEQEVVLERRFSQTLKRYGRSLDFVAAELGGKRVSELERLATALYVSIGETSVPVNKRAQKLVQLKPHVAFGDAVKAVGTVQDMGGRARALRGGETQQFGV